jgi:hypothetical protein
VREGRQILHRKSVEPKAARSPAQTQFPRSLQLS